MSLLLLKNLYSPSQLSFMLQTTYTMASRPIGRAPLITCTDLAPTARPISRYDVWGLNVGGVSLQLARPALLWVGRQQDEGREVSPRDPGGLRRRTTVEVSVGLICREAGHMGNASGVRRRRVNFMPHQVEY